MIPVGIVLTYSCMPSHSGAEPTEVLHSTTPDAPPKMTTAIGTIDGATDTER